MNNTIKYIRIGLFLCVIFIWLTPTMICKAEETLGTEVLEIQTLETDELATEDSKNEIQEIETTITVLELDLGDYQSEMIVGEKQLLYITVIPMNSTNQNITYTSSDTKVATINGIGRITALEVGETTITVTCGAVKETFDLTVKPKESEIETIAEASDIELGDYETELNVDATMSLTATVIPAESTETKVIYESSDERIATVNSSGVVKGISPGIVTIYVSCGKIVKEVSLTVKVATSMIKLDANYKVVNVGEEFAVLATVIPENANRDLRYESANPEIATVSESGVVHAKRCGSTAIIVTNGELQAAITVIVNAEGIVADYTDKPQNGADYLKYPKEVTVEEYGTITTDMLQYYCENKQVLTIKGKDYTIYIDGKDIVNYNNEFQTEVLFQKDEKGISFDLNHGKNLCGTVTLDLSHIVENEKYLYLYNQDKKKYQEMAVSDIRMLKLDSEGRYLLTSKRITGFSVNIMLIIMGSVIVVCGIGVYVGVKKKYWFW